MKILETDISSQVSLFLKESLSSISSFEIANRKLFDVCGILNFFESSYDFQTATESITHADVKSANRTEYGDFQTNQSLADAITKHPSLQNIAPKILIEPTCGTGNFILASLANIHSLEKIFAVEIYKPYIWKTKFNILDFFISHPTAHKPEITITHADIFSFDFKKIAQEFPNEKFLIIGNPPWVTNSKLGTLNSKNLPQKSNFKNQNGLDAITGKGNFDIGEYITLMLLDVFQNHNGILALLVKNSVVRNILHDQQRNEYRIGAIEKYDIDSKKEFHVSVQASLFVCRLNAVPDFECKEFNFYNLKEKLKFGWSASKFVSNIALYNQSKHIDGVCPFEWRQGLKHDSSAIMELEKLDGYFINKLSEKIILEENLVFGFLKSSDLKNKVIKNIRKYTIVTQTKVGEETSSIQHLYPATYTYLKKNIASFQSRKSSIYNGKPQFSIFGIGDYAFKPYKVAISGLYKTYHFSLVLPEDHKPVMLDDTCYFIGFDILDYAVYVSILLNSKTAEEFLKSITFADAKRVFTKDILMRLDLAALASSIPPAEIEDAMMMFNHTHKLNVRLEHWNRFLCEMMSKKELTLFG